MKTVYFIIIAMVLTFTSFAQSTDDIGKIALSVIMPENVDGLNVSQLSKLETKIAQIITASGLAATGYNNNFVIYPKFAINESNIVEGGMQNITVETADLSLFIKQVNNDMLFSSISKSLKGSGSSKELAITNAILQIQTKDPEFKTFIEAGKTKIIQYYEVNCTDIIKKSDSYVKMQQYEQAFGLLMTVPDEVTSCYSQIQSKAIEIYKAYQTQKCAEQIQKAKASIATTDYNTALNILEEVDPSASCFNESQTLEKSIETKIAAEEKKQWDFKMKQNNDAVSLEEQRIAAIKEIAVSYYKSQPTTVNYNYIVK